jgi:hypothetical protein
MSGSGGRSRRTSRAAVLSPFPYPFDYRYQEYPGTRQAPCVHPADASVLTLRGHRVLQVCVCVCVEGGGGGAVL